jgi:RNA polymerase primary sigma factor
MNQEAAFAKAMEEIRSLAVSQGNCVTKEQIEEALGELELSREQMEPVYDYLRTKNIGIGEPLDTEELLTDEDKDYLKEYIEELRLLPGLSEGEKRAYSMAAMAGDKEGKVNMLNLYLPQVVDIARLYVGQGVLLEDLIGEGNVALANGVEMLGCLESPDEVDGMLGKMIMDAMEDCINEIQQEKAKDQQVAEEVNRVYALAKELSEDLRKKITVEELAAETDLTPEEIEEAIRLSGNKIEFFEDAK